MLIWNIRPTCSCIYWPPNFYMCKMLALCFVCYSKSNASICPSCVSPYTHTHIENTIWCLLFLHATKALQSFLDKLINAIKHSSKILSQLFWGEKTAKEIRRLLYFYQSLHRTVFIWKFKMICCWHGSFGIIAIIDFQQTFLLKNNLLW